MTDWLIIVLAIAALWVLWQMLNLIADLIDQHRQASAARSREDSSTIKETERSSSWQQ